MSMVSDFTAGFIIDNAKDALAEGLRHLQERFSEARDTLKNAFKDLQENISLAHYYSSKTFGIKQPTEEDAISKNGDHTSEEALSNIDPVAQVLVNLKPGKFRQSIIEFEDCISNTTIFRSFRAFYEDEAYR